MINRKLQRSRQICTLFGILSLFLLLTACSSATNRQDRSAASAEEPTPIPTAVVPTNPTYAVERGLVQYTADFNGRIAPVIEVPVVFQVSGQVSDVFADRNDTIIEGDELARLDTTLLENELNLAILALDVAQSKLSAEENAKANDLQLAQLELDLAQLDLDYAISVAGNNPTAEQQYDIDSYTILRDIAQLAVDELDTLVDPQLKADVEEAELRVLELEKSIEEAILIAPADGQLVSFNVEERDSVFEGESVGTIANLKLLDISANLQPSQMAELAEGLPVEISFSGRPGETFPGEIRLMPYPYGSNGSANAEPTDESVRISFDDPGVVNGLSLGDRMSISVLIEERPDTLWLPPAAIREFNGRTFVVVQEGQGQSRLDVELGIEGKDRVEILSGLEEGQIVIGQ